MRVPSLSFEASLLLHRAWGILGSLCSGKTSGVWGDSEIPLLLKHKWAVCVLLLREASCASCLSMGIPQAKAELPGAAELRESPLVVTGKLPFPDPLRHFRRGVSYPRGESPHCLLHK